MSRPFSDRVWTKLKKTLPHGQSPNGRKGMSKARFHIKIGNGWWDGDGVLYTADPGPEIPRLSLTTAKELRSEWRRIRRLAGMASAEREAPIRFVRVT